MKRKGQVTEFLMTYGWVILVAIIIISFAYFYLKPNQEQFTIYKEECKIEVNWDGIDLYEEHIENTEMNMLMAQNNYLIRKCDIPDEVREKIEETNGWMYDINWEDEYSLDCIASLLKIADARWTVDFSMEQIEELRNKEVCEEVEVDEIKIPDKSGTRDCKCIEYLTCEEVFKDCSDKKISGGFCKEYGECNYYQFETISKEDLTREFLNKNAECILCYYDSDNSVDLDGYCEDKNFDNCGKYAIGDYTIEVSQ